MKKVSHTILALALFGCFLLLGKSLSGSPLNASLNNIYAPPLYVNTPFFIRHSPLNFLFSFESFDHKVCRKPAYLVYEPVTSFNNLNYNNVFFKTSSLGPNYLRVNENVIFRQGNTFLLVPHSFTLPANSGLETLPAPTMTLPRAD